MDLDTTSKTSICDATALIQDGMLDYYEGTRSVSYTHLDVYKRQYTYISYLVFLTYLITVYKRVTVLFAWNLVHS